MNFVVWKWSTSFLSPLFPLCSSLCQNFPSATGNFASHAVSESIKIMKTKWEQAHLSRSLWKSCQLPITRPQHVQLLAKLTNLGLAICICCILSPSLGLWPPNHSVSPTLCPKTDFWAESHDESFHPNFVPHAHSPPIFKTSRSDFVACLFT